MMDLLPFLNGTPIVFSPFGVLNLGVLFFVFGRITAYSRAATKRMDEIVSTNTDEMSELRVKNGIFETKLASIESAIFDIKETQRTIINTMVANHNANIQTIYRSGTGARVLRGDENVPSPI